MPDARPVFGEPPQQGRQYAREEMLDLGTEPDRTGGDVEERRRRDRLEIADVEFETDQAVDHKVEGRTHVARDHAEDCREHARDCVKDIVEHRDRDAPECDESRCPLFDFGDDHFRDLDELGRDVRQHRGQVDGKCSRQPADGSFYPCPGVVRLFHLRSVDCRETHAQCVGFSRCRCESRFPFG